MKDEEFFFLLPSSFFLSSDSRPSGCLHDGHSHAAFFSVAEDAESGPAPDFGIREQSDEMRRIVNVGAVEFRDDVAPPEALLVGFGARVHAHDEYAARARCAKLLGDLRRHRLELDAGDRSASDSAVLDDVVHHVARQVARHREPDALVTARLAVDGGVDPNQLSARVD
jgi:hypothetical protein